MLKSAGSICNAHYKEEEELLNIRTLVEIGDGHDSGDKENREEREVEGKERGKGRERK